MTRDAAELLASVQDATAAQFRGRLLARGQAQSMIRRDGVLPEEAPQFGAYVDDDLLNYSYALMSISLQLLDLTDAEAPEIDPDEQATRRESAQNGFIQASYALESATRNTEPAEGLAFHRLMAGAASHLGGFAARAFSLMQASIQSGRLTPMEATLADIVLRDLESIEARTMRMRTSPELTDDALLEALHGQGAGDDTTDAETTNTDDDSSSAHEESLDILGPIELLLTEYYQSAVASALFAIVYNQQDLLAAALADLGAGEQAALEIGTAGPWWVYRLTRRLLGDLGQTSIAANLPISPPPAATAMTVEESVSHHRDWNDLRGTFIDTLLARSRSEIDLWPSQLHVVQRIFDNTSDLVVALPTSAGKTRIAEMCILACLAQGRRTVYVTPLRALSAQTEQVLERTFTPLGVSVSSLYGAMGTNDLDDDALRTSQIVVATPEKLDFALRSDPGVLDDVGLVILDEGHMIGPSEREVRYEAQVQRLLRRTDAHTRRIVCLSAVFPSGHDLDDFVAWITDDDPDGLHQEDWRPTAQRFGLVEWRGDYARLTMTLGQDRPFIPHYIQAKTPTGRRKKLFPADDRELVIATAWRLLEEDQSVLIFCPQRNSVEPYAKKILDLRQQGFIDTVLPPGVDLQQALTIGAEWFGEDHPILRCLKLGVAIHHGALPGPFRREVERLLRTGELKVTVASPTLAQGLNLSASAVLFHGLTRAGELMSGSEFANVIGRAGRAFVDTEGLVLYPRYKPNDWTRRQWLQLTTGAAGKTLRSGLIAVSITLINRLLASYGSAQLQPAIDYLTGTPNWALPTVPGEQDATRDVAQQTWRSNLALLDTGLLSILGEDDSDPDQVTQLVADVLRDSLWERQLLRFDEQPATVLRAIVSARARHVWSVSTATQRRGWYLAGVGADDGGELGKVAAQIVELTALAENSITAGELATAADQMLQIATAVFGVSQFQPDTKLLWPPILIHWLSGRPLNQLGEDPVQVAQFIESDLIYRLVWGMEASRVYEAAQGNKIADTLTGTAAMAIEAGTLTRPAAILIRAGFDHRLAAIAAVEQTGATFDSMGGLRQWLQDLDPDVTTSGSWPTIESHAAWKEFASRTAQFATRRWAPEVTHVDDVTWYGVVPPPGAWLRATRADHGTISLWSPGFDLLGQAKLDINPHRRGVLHARRMTDTAGIELHYRGPRDLTLGKDQHPSIDS
ncbi:superfamily II DNA/RNA helicase [Mycobacterium frederiksbergense]|uniref:Superfamily II DNA/RNA helicase n=1 Tax=Mycolicibacterium frederiksbergense TaxID=117567 RepID=A0ABT6KVQ0_9MYCO|nr:DEAD/DEAH box helicase [Mycolicibacterium frederiksbergense]MDH6194057.1 superfamily II DNA/RNA helicase [Mycolicibacterium frederiksbergense]